MQLIWRVWEQALQVAADKGGRITLVAFAGLFFAAASFLLLWSASDTYRAADLVEVEGFVASAERIVTEPGGKNGADHYGLRLRLLKHTAEYTVLRVDTDFFRYDDFQRDQPARLTLLVPRRKVDGAAAQMFVYALRADDNVYMRLDDYLAFDARQRRMLAIVAAFLYFCSLACVTPPIAWARRARR